MTIATVVAVAIAVLRALALCRLGGGRGRRRALAGAEDALQPADHAGGRRRDRGRRNHGRRCRCGHRFFDHFAHRGRLRVLHIGHRRRRDVQLRLGQRVHRQLARGAALVAGLGAFLAQLVLAQAGHFVVRGVQLLVGDDHDRRVVALLDLAERAALFVEQVVGDLHRGLHQHLPGVLLHRVLLGDADDRQRQRLDAAHAAVAVATRADDLAGLTQRRTQALAAHLQQAEARDAADLHPRAVVLERVLQAVLDLALVLVGGHVDEVDDHQAAEVAQAQLARDLFGRLQVGLERGVLDVAALGGARGVDVHRGQRLGLVDHDRAAGRQAHAALVGGLDLRLDLEAVEQRDVVGVVLELAQALRHHLLHELLGVAVHLGGVDQDLADVGAQVVAQGADDQPRFLVDQERRRLGQGGLGDRLPHLQQVVQVPLQLFGIAADAGGADDHAHVVGDVQLVQRFLQRGAVLALDPARDAAGAGRVRHQHHVAAGQGDERGQGRALVAALLLVHLDHDFLALAQQFADRRLVVVDAGLEVIAGDFLQRQEAVALAAVFDEGRFQRGFEPGDAALVDVGLLLFLGRLLDVDVVQGLAVHDGHTQFFCLRGVDQHSLHCCVPRAATARNAMGFRFWSRFVAHRAGAGWASWVSSATTPRRAAGALFAFRWFRTGGDSSQAGRRTGHVQRGRLRHPAMAG
ncbi:hypothetical protein NB700_004301 [Xanthomonas sacchari]|uniref:NAD-specific glutamate dehydrogenase n=1 Tax=Xanthomonas sacchari TaxID=56458 RepID=A0ABT3E1U3_9XANT|nr:hypothetical protein [Xanthomonas sacchari]